MIDLSNLKPGDTVHFRCGGKAVVHSVRISTADVSYKYGVVLANSATEKIPDHAFDPIGFYQIGGTLHGTAVRGPLDIIRVEPAFRWEDVKPGMAFHDNTSDGDIRWFVGPLLGDSNCVLLSYVGLPSDIDDLAIRCKSDLTRAPEHDIEVEQ